MQRKYAFLIAGFFTALATTAAVATSGLTGVPAASPPLRLPPSSRQNRQPGSPARKPPSRRGNRRSRPN